jgi:hypothetical protein
MPARYPQEPAETCGHPSPQGARPHWTPGTCTCLARRNSQPRAPGTPAAPISHTPAACKPLLRSTFCITSRADRKPPAVTATRSHSANGVGPRRASVVLPNDMRRRASTSKLLCRAHGSREVRARGVAPCHLSVETDGLFARISGVSESLRAQGAGPRRKLRR